jgi:hypothetical protein
MPQEKIMNRFALLGMIAFAADVCSQSPVYVPETGIYGDPRRTGEGAFVEVQGEIATVAFFSHTLDGDSTFYVAAGPLKTVNGTPAPCCFESILAGYYPVVYLQADVYKTFGGAILGRQATTGVVPYEPTKVGRMIAEFGQLGFMGVYIAWDQPGPEGVWPETFSILSRRAFGLNAFGVDDITENWCWPDFRGEWVFIDHTRPDQAAERYDFDEVSIVPNLEAVQCPAPQGSLQILTFRDASKDAQLRCVTGTDPLDGQNKRTCEFRVGDDPEPIYWFNPSDLTPTRMIGSLGAFRAGYARTDETVTALRVPKRAAVSAVEATERSK